MNFLSIISLIFVILTLSQIIKADIPIICNQTGAHSNEQVTEWASKIKAEVFPAKRIAVLATLVTNSSLGFTGPQTQRMLSAFTFSGEMSEALSILNLYILGMTCDETAPIIKLFSFSSDRVSALNGIVNFITDLENNATIINAFTFSSEKTDAAKIIAAATGRSCIYGTVIEKRVQFLVDVSFSMKAEFVATDGQRFNRLSFVQQELDTVIRKQLKPDQKFNVFSFAGTVRSWQPGLVDVTSSNVDRAVQFVREMDFRADGTNTYEALRVAFLDPNVEAIYFLTDGQPSVGPVIDEDKIINYVEQWNKNHIPVHCVAFLSGFFDGDNKPAAKRFMLNLATKTGGIYRAIE